MRSIRTSVCNVGSATGSAGGGGLSVGRVSAGGSREEQRAEAALLALRVLLSISGSTATLRAGSSTSGGVVGHRIIRARDLVALGLAADVAGST